MKKTLVFAVFVVSFLILGCLNGVKPTPTPFVTPSIATQTPTSSPSATDTKILKISPSQAAKIVLSWANESRYLSSNTFSTVSYLILPYALPRLGRKYYLFELCVTPPFDPYAGSKEACGIKFATIEFNGSVKENPSFNELLTLEEMSIDDKQKASDASKFFVAFKTHELFYRKYGYHGSDENASLSLTVEVTVLNSYKDIPFQENDDGAINPVVFSSIITPPAVEISGTSYKTTLFAWHPYDGILSKWAIDFKDGRFSNYSCTILEVGVGLESIYRITKKGDEC